MRILITGQTGMLGSALSSELYTEHEIFGTGTINHDQNQIINFKAFDLIENDYKPIIDWSKPHVVLHCAAITDVDNCESSKFHAKQINSESVLKFSRSNHNFRFIFISSDAVFADKIFLANENHPTTPINYYGRTKLTGEAYTEKSSNRALSIRTTIVGQNTNKTKTGFIEWVYNSLQGGKSITLFDDVYFTPITTWHFAKELKWLLKNDITGIIHIAGIEPITKYKFGIKISEVLGLDTSLIRKGSISSCKFSAPRSTDQTLDSSKYQQLSDRKLPSIDETCISISENFLKI